MAAPYRNLGGASADGTKHYRAYFTADFVWHVALTSELGRFEMPPRNPYMAREALHYYWTYFLVPGRGLFARPARRPRRRSRPQGQRDRDGGGADRVVLSARVVGRRRRRARGGWRCSSLSSRPAPKALIAIKDLLARGGSLAELRDINVDAITAWKYDGLRIDGVHRTMFYTPQHGLSCALGLLALVPVMFTGAAAPLAIDRSSAGLLLGLATTINPFLGAAFSLIYGLAVLADAVRTRTPVAPAGRARRGGGPARARGALGHPQRDGRRRRRRLDDRVGRLRAQPRRC